MPFDLSPSGCPYCHGKINSATYGFGFDRPPQSGDFSVCLHCGGLLKLDGTCRAVELTTWEFFVLCADQQAALLQARDNVIRMKSAMKAMKARPFKGN